MLSSSATHEPARDIPTDLAFVRTKLPSAYLPPIPSFHVHNSESARLTTRFGPRATTALSQAALPLTKTDQSNQQCSSFCCANGPVSVAFALSGTLAFPSSIGAICNSDSQLASRRRGRWNPTSRHELRFFRRIEPSMPPPA